MLVEEIERVLKTGQGAFLHRGDFGARGEGSVVVTVLHNRRNGRPAKLLVQSKMSRPGGRRFASGKE